MDVSNESKYTLPHEEHEKIRQKIARDYLADSVKTDKPRAIILAGQPGAGKTGLRTSAREELAPHGGAVVVDTDDLRVYYKNKKRNIEYTDLCAENDRSAAGQVQRDAGKWADELTDDAIAKRRNLIIDGTLKTPKNAEKLCRDLTEKGYDFEIRALAVAKEDSIAGVYNRYERPKSEGGSGRWVPEKEVHNDAYRGLPQSLAILEAKGHADRITVYKRGERGEERPVLIHSGRGAAQALKKERKRERTLEELDFRDKAWNYEAKSSKDPDAGIMQRIRARDPELSEPPNRRADELAAQARDKARSATTKEAATLWTKQSTSTKETGTPWVKHSTSTKEAAEPWTKHSKSSPQQKAGPKSPVK